MTLEWKTKVGDTAKALRCMILPLDRNLNGSTVVFNMMDGAGVNVISSPATIITPTGRPTVEYAWAPTDLDTAGIYRADFTITYLGGKAETFPEDGYIEVEVNERAAPVV